MNKRTIATAAAAVAALPVALVAATASPASAAEPCDSTYAPGASYQLSIQPAYAQISRGTTIVLFTRLYRGQTACDNERVILYTKNSEQTAYTGNRANLTRFDPERGGGIARYTITPRLDFRWFTRFNAPNGSARAVSDLGLVQVTPRIR